MRRVTVAAVVAASAAMLLAGCTPPVPVAGIASPPEVTAATTVDQAERIQKETFLELAAADEAKSVEGLTVRVGGDAKLVREAEYKRATAEDGAAPDVLPAAMQAVYVSSALSWPRTLVSVSTQPSEDTTPVVSLWVQDDIDTPYQMRNWAHMVPGATLPAMPGPSVGTDQLSMDTNIGESTLQEVVDDYLTLVTDGASSELNDAFAEDSYRNQLFANRKVLTEVAKTADGTYVDKIEGVPDATFAIADADGGALIFAPLRMTSTVTVKDAKVTIPAADKPLVDGKIVDKATYEYVDMIVMYVPASESDDLPGVVAAEHHVVRVSPGGEK